MGPRHRKRPETNVKMFRHRENTNKCALLDYTEHNCRYSLKYIFESTRKRWRVAYFIRTVSKHLMRKLRPFRNRSCFFSTFCVPVIAYWMVLFTWISTQCWVLMFTADDTKRRQIHRINEQCTNFWSLKSSTDLPTTRQVTGPNFKEHKFGKFPHFESFTYIYLIL